MDLAILCAFTVLKPAETLVDNNEPTSHRPFDPLQKCFSFHLAALQVVKRCHHSCGLLIWHWLFWHLPSTNLQKLETIIDYSTHWISWNNRVTINIWNWRTLVRPYEFVDCCSRGIGCRHNMLARSFLVINAFSVTSKLLTPSMYRWSRKIFVTIHWTHFTVNSTCHCLFFRGLSFRPQKKQTLACCCTREDLSSNAAILIVC